MQSSALLRTSARIASPISAVVSIGLTLYAGRHNHSWLLPVLFTLWVSSPFVAILLAGMAWKHWPVAIRRALDWLALILAIGTPAIYGYVALGPPRAQAAFVFVVVPPASWLLIAIMVAAGIYHARAARKDVPAG